MKPIRTIGHSNHLIERFVELLKAGGVERLVDVRSVRVAPLSRNSAASGLSKSLAEAGIDYVMKVRRSAASLRRRRVTTNWPARPDSRTRSAGSSREGARPRCA